MIMSWVVDTQMDGLGGLYYFLCVILNCEHDQIKKLNVYIVSSIRTHILMKDLTYACSKWKVLLRMALSSTNKLLAS